MGRTRPTRRASQPDRTSVQEAFVPELPKESGAYFTPDKVVRSLVRWAVRSNRDRLLDPSCGSGHFLAVHPNSVGIEQNARSAAEAIRRAPGALVHEGDFFTWAAETSERFECAAGNPPFIRYQSFKGEVRERAQALCAKLGADFSGLSSSWPPFLVASASLLKRGGRMAFVVPAEIGHAPYSAPLLEYLVAHFSTVHVTAVREKLFPDLSEDCWLLRAENFGGRTSEIEFSVVDRFSYSPTPPNRSVLVSVLEWRELWNRRLRPFLLPKTIRDVYVHLSISSGTRRFGELASVGIGYVTGANDFFHLRPSCAQRWDIPQAFLQPTVRNGRALPSDRLTTQDIAQWRERDEPVLLLRLEKDAHLTAGLRRYLATDTAEEARQAYKCRTRDPWYAVPDVRVPDFFLTYMSGRKVSLVRNDAGATCTNSIHAVQLKNRAALRQVSKVQRSPLFQLSSELEGHPLGGGMLKLEPREATRILIPHAADLEGVNPELVREGVATLQSWRHYGE
ncbi:MAG: N-6 DNA methylase [Bryobacteraceae bacterium]|nr:N-6 DNA methylase [Bryobacteraceae bacterium]